MVKIFHSRNSLHVFFMRNIGLGLALQFVKSFKRLKVPYKYLNFDHFWQFHVKLEKDQSNFKFVQFLNQFLIKKNIRVLKNLQLETKIFNWKQLLVLVPVHFALISSKHVKGCFDFEDVIARGRPFFNELPTFTTAFTSPKPLTINIPT